MSRAGFSGPTHVRQSADKLRVHMTHSSSGETILDRMLRILSAFDARRRQRTVAELSQDTNIPLATTYRLVSQLTQEDILTRYPNGTVGLGMRLWELAARSSPAVGLRTIAMPFLDDVQGIFRQHTQRSALDDHEVVIAQRLSSQIGRASCRERV